MSEEKQEVDDRTLYEQFVAASKETLIDNATGRNAIIGASIRMVGAFSIGLFKPLYFANVYPENID